jgi:hypothetical protein
MLSTNTITVVYKKQGKYTYNFKDMSAKSVCSLARKMIQAGEEDCSLVCKDTKGATLFTTSLISHLSQLMLKERGSLYYTKYREVNLGD